MNAIRRANRALQQDARLAFYPTDNDQILCYAKSTEDRSNVILTVVNIDPRYPQFGWVDLDLHELGLPHDLPYEVHDLLSDARFRWQGARNYVALTPGDMPAHVLRLPAPPGAAA
jgi:starch synthase (maltosyl-transferring)